MKVLEYIRDLAICGIVFLLYYFLPKIIVLPFYGILTKTHNNIIINLIYLLMEILCLLPIILIYIKPLIEDLKKFKFKNLLPGFIYWIIGFIGMFICNLILIIFLGTNVSDNEAINRELFTKLPLYAIPAMTFIGPIMEELVFRFNLRKVCKNKVLFIIVSSLIFAGAHLIVSFDSFSSIITNYTDLFYLFPYLCLAISFSLCYRETDNIFTSMFYHIIHNSYCIIILIIGLFIWKRKLL